MSVFRCRLVVTCSDPDPALCACTIDQMGDPSDRIRECVTCLLGLPAPGRLTDCRIRAPRLVIISSGR
ncbi:MAG: hypothetical protein JJ953_05830 [Gracilimonas sp.]|uniref:hypothetical protein n=1 Tax=Gracilimonas TaxID=649462 RepID=UPI001B21DA0E|nr:hypothetical protein [Gracilimonas sp.]MBO6585604.1 hypothetical protein [Gracilimonas sp.]MBO6616601.1 hypothetical protein [Gracilimonas sp.]